METAVLFLRRMALQHFSCRDLNGSVAAHLSEPRKRTIYEALLCPSTSVSSSPPSVKGYGRTCSMSEVNDSHRPVCLLVGCLARCLWITSHQHRHLEPPQQRSDRQASGTATVSSRNRSWGFPSSLRPGGLAPAWLRRLRPRARLPSLLPLLPPPFSPPSKEENARHNCRNSCRHRQHKRILTPRTPWPSGDREPATGRGRGASCEKAVRNDVRHKYRGNKEQRQ